VAIDAAAQSTRIVTTGRHDAFAFAAICEISEYSLYAAIIGQRVRLRSRLVDAGARRGTSWLVRTVSTRALDAAMTL
jgi:hypothetical protein